MLGRIGLKIWGYIAAGGGFLVAALLFWNKAKNAGRKEVKDAVNAKTTEKVIEIVEEDRKIEKDVDNMSNDDVTDELLKHSRDRDNS